MVGRPLSYLATLPLDVVSGIGAKLSKSLGDAGMLSVADLLLHAPRRHIDRSQLFDLADVPLDEEVTVGGVVRKYERRRIRGGKTMVVVTVGDGTSVLRVVWFNPYVRFDVGTELVLSGKLERFQGSLQMKNPDWDRLDRPGDTMATGRVVPIHRGIGGVTPTKLRGFVANALRRASPIHEVLPAEMLERLGLVERHLAIQNIHFPETMEEVEPARRRLVFDELFRLELTLALRREEMRRQSHGLTHDVDGELVDRFVAALPYRLTAAQDRVIDEIRRDLAAPLPMQRLLEGEVGSGKTVVAAACLLTGVQSGHQGAVMAPTEVLAVQHYLGLRDLLEQAGLSPPLGGGRRDMDSLFTGDDGGPTVRTVLLTSGSVEASWLPPGSARRAVVVDAIADGSAELVVGTHALIQDELRFHGLGVAVVDEQHRFGVQQRDALRSKADGHDPDVLIMTATPIPRTVAMTLYGDLDVSLLDEMPPGRSPVRTTHVPWPHIDDVYELIRTEVAQGRQAFVVCPLVEESDKIEAASATAEYERLSRILDDLRVGLLHGQMRADDKDRVMHSFRDGELDVLVATTVIEVGIDVPNATVMVIEDADRFGLSQLHQLRGRVGRGKHPGMCVLVAEPTTVEGEQRIEAMLSTSDGHRLAEMDLRIRGQGTVFGERQTGMKDLKLADILRDAKLLEIARREAFALVAADPGLSAHGDIADEVEALLGAEAAAWLFRS